MPLTREQLAARIMQLPPGTRQRAIEAIRVLYPPPVGTVAPTPEGLAPRDPEQRNRYVGDPWRYIADVFGYHLTPDEERALDLLEKHERVLFPSGNGTGKTFVLGTYGIYRLDVIATLPDKALGMEEQGGFILLPGPDHNTIFSTIYMAMLAHAALAERRGFKMPGERSEKSVLWRAGPRWQVEAFSPAESSESKVAHGASGRHHNNQVAIIEEGQGVPEAVWLGTEGMCSGEGNKIASAFNPFEPVGPAYKRSRGGIYTTMHISALNHPNIRERRNVIPGAIALKNVEDRMHEECVDRGPASEVVPDEDHHDFVYALPAKSAAAEEGARDDGVVGARSAEPHVFRPGDTFTAQVLGQWPKTSTSSLFNAAALDRAIARWIQRWRVPETPPDMVGCDPAREGKDSSGVAPRWGEDAEALLRRYAEAIKVGPHKVDEMRANDRQLIGPIEIIAKGDGVFVAQELVRRFPDSPFVCDDGGVGASVLDHTKHVIGRQISGTSFGGSAFPPTPGEPWSENMRTQLYVRAARLVAFGLVDVPNDLLLREELLAHSTEPRTRSVEEIGEDGVTRKVRRSSVLLLAKEKVKKLLGGRSPDRADAFVLAVSGDPAPKPTPWEVW